MKTTIIESFWDYIDYTEPFKNQFYFRGQANADWEIIPSLFRECCEISLETEREMVQREVEATGLSTLSALLKLQHYGTPTRICDLTISPMSALFFAVCDETQVGNDGIIYVFDKAQSVSATSESTEILSQVYAQDDTSSFLSDIAKNGLLDCVTTDYIIQYDYRFSYTNKRAILQGGTGLLFGFGHNGNQLTLHNNSDISGWIVEKIVIPSVSKSEVAQKLYQIGYSKDILYNQFENTHNCENFNLIETENNLTRKADFNKYVAKYKISTLYYNNDELVKKIADIYDDLFARIGANARIWLSIYYDDEDVKHFNWICQTDWNAGAPYYSIRWTRNYYENRLRNLNEQSSQRDVLCSYSKLLNEITPLYLDIQQSVHNYNSLEKTVAVIRQHLPKVVSIDKEANNIPYCNTETDAIAVLALSFINNVDWLIRDMMIFHARMDENKQTSWYLLNSLYLSKCEESRKKLDAFYDFMEINYPSTVS